MHRMITMYACLGQTKRQTDGQTNEHLGDNATNATIRSNELIAS